jgi:hypothetical protein
MRLELSGYPMGLLRLLQTASTLLEMRNLDGAPQTLSAIPISPA